jgi:membrane fusion protein (multidrug efflux system)
MHLFPNWFISKTRGAVRGRVAATMAIFVLGACAKKAPPAAPPPGPVEVSVVTLAPQTVTLNRELPGRTSAFLVAEVRPQVSGIVQQRLFTEGGMVKAGDPLYQLEDATYRAEAASAKAALNRAQAALELARINATRSANLAKEDVVSRQESENATAALRQAEAETAVAQAAVTRAEVMLGYTRITSPISGRIGKSSVTQGALVTANQATPLATVQQLDPIYVDLSQSSRELLELRQEIASGRLQRPDDMPVTILLEDGTPYDQRGKLAFTEVTVDPTTGSFALRVVVPNPQDVLLPGMYVRAIVATGVRENAILVPQPGITRDAKGDTAAMVVTQDGKVQPRQVLVSRTVGDKWLVEKGLNAGDKVIVEGLQKARPGAAVHAVEFIPPAQRPAPPNGSMAAAPER